MSSTLRRRFTSATDNKTSPENSAGAEERHGDVEMQSGSYWLTRIVFIRALGLVYLVAFLVALNQNKELVGSNGLLPFPEIQSRIRKAYKIPENESAVTWTIFTQLPSLFWWISEHNIDLALDTVAYIGIVLSAILVVLGSGNVLILVVLRLLYHSLISVGQVWYGFGWETQLLETGFLALMLVPVLSLRQFPRHTPPSWVAVWGYRWLLFRIMLGAGLIKIRGDQCWRDLTCMNYHYETQPVPNPLSYYLHQAPEALHTLETLGNHAVELVVPFFLFLPRPLRLVGGAIQILFQVALILSGNLSFLNWLTILPAIFCFDDLSLRWLFSSHSRHKVMQLQQAAKNGEARPVGYYIRQASNVGVALLLGYLSIPVVQNLLSSNQMMNTSFDPLKIVNTYGAFGSVTKHRTEVILEGTHNSNPGPSTAWQEIEFKCKPGSTIRRPCIISPYHYRLDWLMWFAAFQGYRGNAWLVHVGAKVMAGDPSIERLIEHNPFADNPPKFIRALHYSYRYTELGSKEAAAGHWWRRELIGEYLPVLSEPQVRGIVRKHGWTWYNSKTSKGKT